MQCTGFLFLLCLCYVGAYKILVISPMPARSHSILTDAIVKHLSNAGHEITYATVFVPEKPPPGVTIVDVSDNLKIFDQDEPINIKKVLDKTDENTSIVSMLSLIMDLSNRTLSNPNFQKLLSNRNIYFDVIIIEWMFSEVYAGLSNVYNCPYVWFSTVEPHWMILDLIDEAPNPSYNVDVISDSVPPFTFVQRVKELSSQVLGRLLRYYYTSSAENQLYEEYIIPHIKSRGGEVSSLDTLKYNASLVLSNSHVSLGLPIRHPVNLIPIGGYHIDFKVKPLPENLQSIMDNASHGVIYFSMGSNLRSQHFPDEIKHSLLKIFGELKQTVLWKFEEDLPNRPSNVHILKWAPQQSILAHKNCKLFITHGGLLSTTETIHFGVPIIGIPVFADQYVNVDRSVKKGFAKRVYLSYTMASELHEAIIDILGDPKYTQRVKELSLIYHDRIATPDKELIHWVEHVVKTRGAPHLRSLAFSVNWYQKIYLDLVLVIISIFTSAFIILKYCYNLIKIKMAKKIKKS